MRNVRFESIYLAPGDCHVVFVALLVGLHERNAHAQHGRVFDHGWLCHRNKTRLVSQRDDNGRRIARLRRRRQHPSLSSSSSNHRRRRRRSVACEQRNSTPLRLCAAAPTASAVSVSVPVSVPSAAASSSGAAAASLQRPLQALRRLALRLHERRGHRRLCRLDYAAFQPPSPSSSSSSLARSDLLE